ncbi:MAG: LysE family transporter [Desulfuromonadales bacterium]|nr:LysE family transporter [Desulfuromonadales bacterium]
MTLPVIAATSFMLGLSGAMMPGPLLTLTISESARRGVRAGPQLILGHALVEGLLVALLLIGLADLVQRPEIFGVIAMIGGAMLFWMGGGMLRSLPTLSLDLEQRKPEQGLSPVLAGGLISLANPYFTLWWATIGIGYLTVTNAQGWAGGLTFYLFHILADLAWYILIAYAVSRGRHLLADRPYRLLIGGCALFLIGFGGYFGYHGVAKLMAL